MFKLKHLKHISIITLILFALAAIAVAGPGFSGRSYSSSSSRSFSSGGSSWSKPSSSSWSRPSTPSSSSWSKPAAPSSSSWSFSSSKPASTRSNYFSEVVKTTPKVTIPATKTYDTGYKPVKEMPSLPNKNYTQPRTTTRTVEKHYYNNSGGDNTLNTIVAASVLSNAMRNDRPQTVVVNSGTPVSAEAVPSAPQNLRVETVKEEGGMGFFGWIVSLGIVAGLCYALYRLLNKHGW